MAKAKTKSKSKSATKSSPKSSSKSPSKSSAKSTVKSGSKSASSKSTPKVAAKSSAKKAVAKKASAPKASATKASSAVKSKASAPKASAPKTTKKAAPKAATSKGAPKKALKEKTTMEKATGVLKSVAKAIVDLVPHSNSSKSAKPKKVSAAVMKAFTPLDNRVLVQREGVSDRTAGGLFIPDTASSVERPNRGHVLAVGNGHRNKKGQLRPLDVQVGDTVMFGNFSGSEVTIEGETYLLLREDEILAIAQ